MSSSTEPGPVRVARLGRPHGLDGFLGLYVDPPDLIHFEAGASVQIGEQPMTVRTIRKTDKGYQVAFVEVTDRTGAEAIRNHDVFVGEPRPLDQGEFWPSDLIGLEVRPGGGRVVGLEQGPAQDRLVIEREGITFEVPFVEALVPVVDLEQGFVEIVEIDGLY